MSLKQEHFYEAPNSYHYKRRSQIPEDKWCKECEGLAFVRVQNSLTGRDWAICKKCYGTGKVIE